MCICVCVYVYTCTCVCVYLYMCICWIHIKHVYKYTYMCTYICRYCVYVSKGMSLSQLSDASPIQTYLILGREIPHSYDVWHVSQLASGAGLLWMTYLIHVWDPLLTFERCVTHRDMTLSRVREAYERCLTHMYDIQGHRMPYLHTWFSAKEPYN